MLKEIPLGSIGRSREDANPVALVENIGKRLSETKIPELREKMVAEALKSIKEVLEGKGWKYVSDVNSLYHAFRNQNLLVRREDPLRFLSTTAAGQPLKIEFDPNLADVVGEKYANCAEWSYDSGERGLKNAFLEGNASLGDSLVFVVGFKPGKDLKVNDISADKKFVHDLDRTLVRSAEGSVNPNDLMFVVVRVPAKFFPKNEMTGAELDAWEKEAEVPPRDQKQQVFRSFVSSN